VVVLGASLALGSSLTGGASDFMGGVNSRRIGTMPWMFGTQLVGAAIALGWALFSGAPLPGLTTALEAIGAGLSIMVGLAAFFEAMVLGAISIVAPISATGVVVPIAAGVIGGERPAAVQVGGILAAIIGIVVVSGGPRARSFELSPALGLALVAALASGLFFWLMSLASHGGVPWAMVIGRGVAVLGLAAALAKRGAPLRPALTARNAWLIPIAAVLGSAGFGLYAESTLHTGLAIASVLGSLYPVVTVLCAYVVLGERVHGLQRLGIVTVFAGIVMMSA
jgi:drug/metabolite transporter (DMT)-like permease